MADWTEIFRDDSRIWSNSAVWWLERKWMMTLIILVWNYPNGFNGVVLVSYLSLLMCDCESLTSWPFDLDAASRLASFPGPITLSGDFLKELYSGRLHGGPVAWDTVMMDGSPVMHHGRSALYGCKCPPVFTRYFTHRFALIAASASLPLHQTLQFDFLSGNL